MPNFLDIGEFEMNDRTFFICLFKKGFISKGRLDLSHCTTEPIEVTQSQTNSLVSQIKAENCVFVQNFYLRSFQSI